MPELTLSTSQRSMNSATGDGGGECEEARSDSAGIFKQSMGAIGTE
jgi:hypothetical protein